MWTTESSNRCSSSNTIAPVFKFLKHEHILLQDLLHFHLHIDYLHSHGWLAPRQLHLQVLLHKLLIPQCLSPPVQRSISPSCRLSVAGNETLLVLASMQAKFQVGCIFSFLFRCRFTFVKTQVPWPHPFGGSCDRGTWNNVKVMRPIFKNVAARANGLAYIRDGAMTYFLYTSWPALQQKPDWSLTMQHRILSNCHKISHIVLIGNQTRKFSLR